jgi:hypothetical protein
MLDAKKVPVDSDSEKFFEFIEFAKDPANKLSDVSNKLLDMQAAGDIGQEDAQNLAMMNVMRDGTDWTSLAAQDKGIANVLATEGKMGKAEEEHKGFMSTAYEIIINSAKSGRELVGPIPAAVSIFNRFFKKAGAQGVKALDFPKLAWESVVEESNRNPRKTEYPVDRVFHKSGGWWKVTGHDTDGEPIVEAVKQ